MTKSNFIQKMICGILILMLPAITFSQANVRVWEADETIPTYTAGPPDPNPMFFFGKQSQGAEGRIYPYPLYDNLTNVRGSKTYHVVYIENEFVRIGIMPELGGRLFSALDKTNNYDFVYKQKVIKPALIGLIGAWISGGIEWNIPHHHRASTFCPVQWSTEEYSDGSKTIWVGELEIRHRMRWAVGYTLHPGSSVLDCKMRIINRTPVEHTMLCFANIAVAPNDNYQVIFPPSTQFSTGHSKRSFNPWPVVNGNDVSWYKNNKSSASWFCVNDKEDFVAGYDYGLDAGIMNIGDHNIVPGKKFFTWGVGSMWDKILSDDGRPYLEIMVGAYSDNQPDYSWLQPFEERAFDINIYPFRGTDGVKNANLDAAVNLDIKDGKAKFGFYTTKSYNNATVYLKSGNNVIHEEKIAISPAKPYSKEVPVPAGTDANSVKASIIADGKELIAYTPVVNVPEEAPKGYNPPEAPEKITDDEELFLAGQRIDLFHNPTLDADPYYEEVLKRDPSDVAANTGMAILALRDARYTDAENHCRAAIARLTAQHTTAKNVEPFYYLGVALKSQGKYDEAYTAYYKAAWKEEWKSPAYFAMAEIKTMKGELQSALDLTDRSLDANAYNVRAYGLKSSILRQMNRADEAARLITVAREKCDPLDVHLMAEQWLAKKDAAIAKTLFPTMIDHSATAQELASDYFNCGLWNDGTALLQQLVSSAPDKSKSPIVYYYLGYFAEKTGDNAKAAEYRKQASLQSPEYVFPFQDELIVVLGSAMKANPDDARAPYYLGNMLYDLQPEAAAQLWEKSSALDPSFAITWRNLAIAYSHQEGEGSQAKAIACLEKAVASQKPYPTHFVELDRLYQAINAPVEKRLALMEKNQGTVIKSDESLGNLINLKIFAGKAQEAIQLMKGRTFSIWEGGQPFNSGMAWIDANLILGMQHMKAKKYKDALACFETALTPPENLRAEQRFDQRIPIVTYWKGCAYEALKDTENAKKAWNEVVNPESRTFREGVAGGGVAAGGGMGPGGPAASRRIPQGSTLQQAEQKYYQALSKMKLGSKQGNEQDFNELIKIASDALNQPARADNAQQFSRRQQIRSTPAMAHYSSGLGYAGLGNKKKAKEEFNAALASSPDYLAAKIALDQL